MSNRQAATNIVYNEETEKFLLMKRANSRELNPGKWEFPGGGVKEDETPRQAAIRELIEETGIKGKIIRSGEPGQIKTSKGKLDIHPFLVKTDSETVKISKEHSEYKWLSINEIKEKETVEGIMKELEALNIDL